MASRTEAENKVVERMADRARDIAKERGLSDQSVEFAEAMAVAVTLGHYADRGPLR